MLTVRQAFELAYGRMPGGAFHMLVNDDDGGAYCYCETIFAADGTVYVWDGEWFDNENHCTFGAPKPYGPALDERPAEYYAGFFGEGFDQVISEHYTGDRCTKITRVTPTNLIIAPPQFGDKDVEVSIREVLP